MIKQSLGDRILISFFYIILVLLGVYCLVPFLTTIMSSFMKESNFVREGYSLLPREFSLDAYKLIFETNVVFKSYGVTIFVTVVGTTLSLIFTSMFAYALSVKSLKYRNKIAFYIFFTMLFNGGLVPTYILISKYLHLKESLWVLIIPVLLNPWNMFLLRNFFSTIDESLAESAKIDGASDIYIWIRIILPLSMPAMATIGLFYALSYWNEWFNAMLFISDPDKFPLQYLIMRILRNLDFANQISADISIPNLIPPTYTVRLATAVVTIGPIVFLYPFIQKYFVKGLMVGAVKG